MLELYDIEEVYVCAASLAERGLTAVDLLIPVTALSPAEIRHQWGRCTTHISF
ncbi:sulfur relay protein TusC [compost metagenome]